jgi:hypothetical protein
MVTCSWIASVPTNINDPSGWLGGIVPSDGDWAGINNTAAACLITNATPVFGNFFYGGQPDQIHISGTGILNTSHINDSTHGTPFAGIVNAGKIVLDSTADALAGANFISLSSTSTGSIEVVMTAVTAAYAIVGKTGSIISSLKLSGENSLSGFFITRGSTITSLDVSGITGASQIGYTTFIPPDPTTVITIPSGETLSMPPTPSWLHVENVDSSAGGAIRAIGGSDGGGNLNWVFSNPTYTLTYTAGAHGSISGTTPQTVTSGGNGSSVTAVPATGYHFTSWSDGVLTATRQELNVTANHSVTASFAINTYTLTYSAGAGGSITGTSPQTVNYGASGSSITATPNSAHVFSSWSDGVLTASRTDTNVTSNLSVTASFLPMYTITYSLDSNKRGYIIGVSPQVVVSGGNGVAVEVIPYPNFVFAGWSDGVATNVRRELNVTMNISVTPTFRSIIP